MPTTLITGANRGIGLGLARSYTARGWEVIACCRQPQDAQDLEALTRGAPTLRIEALDVTSAASIAALSDRLAVRAIDLLINNAGVIGPFPLVENLPRQRFGHLDLDLWMDVLKVNTLGPVKLAEALVEQVARSEQKKIVTLSSSVGSIGACDIAAMAYATSKAAVNKAMQLTASALREREIHVLTVCPGHVRTRMAMGGGELEVEESVEALVSLFARIDATHSGRFLSHTGEPIPW